MHSLLCTSDINTFKTRDDARTLRKTIAFSLNSTP